MNYDRQLHSAFWLTIAVLTIGAVDMPGKGRRKLPSPRNYVAAIVVYAVLGLISDFGNGKAAAVMGWVTVLTGMVAGSFGKAVIGFLNTVSSKFAVQPVDTSTTNPNLPSGAGIFGAPPIGGFPSKQDTP